MFLNKLDQIRNNVGTATKVREVTEMLRYFKADSNRIMEIERYIGLYEYDATELEKHFNRKSVTIGFIGLEKAGKTSLINSLLGIQLLPTDSKKATCVPTYIRHCPKDVDQTIEIEYLTRLEYESYKKELISLKSKYESRSSEEKTYKDEERYNEEAENSDSHEHEDDDRVEQTLKKNSLNLTVDKKQPIDEEMNRLKDELADIDRIEKDTKFNSILGSPTKKDKYKSPKDIQDQLKLIADADQSRFIKRITITNHNVPYLDQLGVGLTYVDMPGVNSILLLHKLQFIKNLDDFDSIIFVKPFKRADFSAQDKSVVDEIIRSDSYLKINEKIILALNQFDEVHTAEVFQKTVEDHKKIWRDYDVKRIIPVCSLAVIGDKDEKIAIVERLKRLNHPDNGIDALKHTIINFVSDERRKTFDKQYEINVNKFKHLKDNIIELGQQIFPDMNIEENETEEDKKYPFSGKKMEIELTHWASIWNRLIEKFRTYYAYDVFKRDTADEMPKEIIYLNEFRSSYVENIRSIINDVKSHLQRRYLFLYTKGGGPTGYSSPLEGHISARHFLYDEMRTQMKNFASDLSNTLRKAVHEIINWIHQQMWGINEIPEILMKESNLSILSLRIETIILRFVTPAMTLLLRYSRNKTERKSLMKYYMEEILILDMFHKNKNKYLMQYLATGKHDPITYQKLECEIDKIEFTDPNSTSESILQEIQDDLAEFEDYMIDSVYYASGVEELFKNELERISNKFTEEENNHHNWLKIFLNEKASGRNILLPDDEFLIYTNKRREAIELLNQIKNGNLGEIKIDRPPSLDTYQTNSDDEKFSD